MAKLSDIIPQSEIDDYLESSDDVLDGKLELANEVVEYAQSISPVDSGDYREGIKARRYGRTGVGVVWTDDKSELLEYGSIHNRPFAVMRKTVEHFSNGGE